MKTIVKLEDLKTIDQHTDFLSSTQTVTFAKRRGAVIRYRRKSPSVKLVCLILLISALQ